MRKIRFESTIRLISAVSAGNLPKVTNDPYQFLGSILPEDLHLHELFRLREQDIIPRQQVVDFLVDSIVKVLSIIQQRAPNLRSPRERKIVSYLSQMSRRLKKPVDMEFLFKVLYRYFGVLSSNHH